MPEHLTKKDLFERFLASDRVVEYLRSGECSGSTGGLPGALKAFLLAALRNSGKEVLYLAGNENEVEGLLFDLAGLADAFSITRSAEVNTLREKGAGPRLICCLAELSGQQMGREEKVSSIYFELSGQTELEEALAWLADQPRCSTNPRLDFQLPVPEDTGATRNHRGRPRNSFLLRRLLPSQNASRLHRFPVAALADPLRRWSVGVGAVPIPY